MGHTLSHTPRKATATAPETAFRAVGPHAKTRSHTALKVRANRSIICRKEKEEKFYSATNVRQCHRLMCIQSESFLFAQRSQSGARQVVLPFVLGPMLGVPSP